MKVDVLKHSLVPKHKILSKKEAEEVLEKFNITKGQLPKILISDPVVKKIEAKGGDIIKITRHSNTSGESVIYRIVTA